MTKNPNKFIVWLLTEPQALKVLMIYSLVVGIFTFASLLGLAIYLRWWWGSYIIIGALLAASCVKLYQTRKFIKYVDYNLGYFVGVKGVKEEGDNDGNTTNSTNTPLSPEPGIQNDDGYIREGDQKVRAGVQKSPAESEPADISFDKYIRTPKKYSAEVINRHTAAKSEHGIRRGEDLR